MTDLLDAAPGVGQARATIAALKLLAPVIGVIAIAGGGFVAAEIYEHKVPWGLGAKVTSAQRHVAQDAKALDHAAAALRAASVALAARDAAIRDNAAGESRDATKTEAFWKGQANAAFDAGRAICRAVGGPGAAGGMRDFRTLWSAGAFPGSAASAAPHLSSQPDG